MTHHPIHFSQFDPFQNRGAQSCSAPSSDGPAIINASTSGSGQTSLPNPRVPALTAGNDSPAGLSAEAYRRHHEITVIVCSPLSPLRLCFIERGKRYLCLHRCMHFCNSFPSFCLHWNPELQPLKIFTWDPFVNFETPQPYGATLLMNSACSKLLGSNIIIDL